MRNQGKDEHRNNHYTNDPMRKGRKLGSPYVLNDTLIPSVFVLFIVTEVSMGIRKT